MDQSLLLSDEVHLLKIRNFDKLQSKLKNISLTDKKNTAGADSTFLISAGNVVLTSVGVIFVNWCVLLKDLSKNESELITTIVQLGGGGSYLSRLFWRAAKHSIQSISCIKY